MKKKIAFFFAMALIALLCVFIVQNLQDVDLRFLAWGGQITLAGPILIAYALGGLTARPVWRFLNAQRVQRKTDKKAEKAAETKLQSPPPDTTRDSKSSR
ncbi:MAG: hypothetical protein JKY56_06185 [Kofleriaceae bacterium]|nr:hypothetical protein [Kofleriaceae bacterium]